jgi:hypothetical protein
LRDLRLARPGQRLQLGCFSSRVAGGERHVVGLVQPAGTQRGELLRERPGPIRRASLTGQDRLERHRRGGAVVEQSGTRPGAGDVERAGGLLNTGLETGVLLLLGIEVGVRLLHLRRRLGEQR